MRVYTSPRSFRMAVVELMLEERSPIDSALYAWAANQEPGVTKAFIDRFLCDRLRTILEERAELIEKTLPEELRSLTK